MHRGAVDHVHVVRVHVSAPRAEERENAVDARRDVPTDVAAAHVRRQVDRIGFQFFARAGAAVGEDAEQLVAAARREQHRALPGGADEIDVVFEELHGREIRVFRGPQPVGVARGEALVVEQPDAHPARLAGGHHDVHVAPPFGAAEVLVRPRFDAKRAGAAAEHALHEGGQFRAVSRAHPEERQEGVSLPAVQNVVEAGVHGQSCFASEIAAGWPLRSTEGRGAAPSVGAGTLRTAKAVASVSPHT